MPIPEPDVWGLAFCDVHAGRLKSAVLRRDDGYAEDVPEMIASYFGPPEAHHVKLLGSLSGRVLDVGCGVGRHVLWLQERGIEVVGIDHSPGAIEVARQRGCREVHLGGVADVDFPEGHFDAAIMLGNNAGIGGTVEGCVTLFERLRRWVRPRGRLMAESRDPVVSNHPNHLIYDEANRAAGRPSGQVRWRLECRERIGEWFCVMLFQPQELEQVIARAGWHVTDTTTHDGALFVTHAKVPTADEST